MKVNKHRSNERYITLLNVLNVLSRVLVGLFDKVHVVLALCLFLICEKYKILKCDEIKC